MQVFKWDNSLAILLPEAVVEVLDLKEGDEIEIGVAGENEVLAPRSPGDHEALARLRKYRGLMPADFKFDRMQANKGRG